MVDLKESTDILQKLTLPQLFKKLIAIYENRKFITKITTACDLCQSLARLKQSMPSLLSFHLRLDPPKSIFPPVFLIKTLCAVFFYFIRATRPVPLTVLSLVTGIMFVQKYSSEAFLYAILFGFLLVSTSCLQIPSLATYSR